MLAKQKLNNRHNRMNHGPFFEKNHDPRNSLKIFLYITALITIMINLNDIIKLRK